MNNALMLKFMDHVNQQEAAVTFQVYMELCEVKRYYHVSYKFNENLNKIVILASKTKTEPVCAFVPIKVNEQMTFSKMRQISQVEDNAAVYIAIVHPDSTCVYYQVKDDLMEPTEISVKHLKVNKQEKLDADLKKNRELLQHAALTGVAVTLKTEEKSGTF